MKCVKTVRRGSVLLYMSIAMVAFTGLAALAVDVAHGRLVKVQLQGAADAAARAAAAKLQSGTDAAQYAALSVAASNIADGKPVTLTPGVDLDFGTWTGTSFVPYSGTGTVDTVRIRCVRSTARGNPVGTIFGSLLGLSNRDVSAQAIATGRATFFAGFIGYQGITAKNSSFFGGYSSSITTTPSESGANSNVRVGTNSFMAGKNGDDIWGDGIFGPNASNQGFTVHRSTDNESSDIPMPVMPTWNPQSNPGNLSMDYATNGNTTLAGGTYYFNSMSIDANLTFTGPTTLYVNGPIIFGGVIQAASGIPSDLTIYQLTNSTFGDTTSNGMTLSARVLAPYSDFVTKNALIFRGTGIFNSIYTKNTADFFYDQDQGPADGSNFVATVN